MFVKVCGITEPRQVDWAVEAGYSAVGFVLHANSPRYCSPSRAGELARYARGRITTVGVALEKGEMRGCEDEFDLLQLYTWEQRDNLIYACKDDPGDMKCRFIMYDASRGGGTYTEPPSWTVSFRERLIISGGLDSDNAGSVIRRYRPFGIDVSSSVEKTPGVKDRTFMFRFIQEVRNETR